MKIDEVNVDSFLRLGYFIGFNEELCPINFSNIDRSHYSRANDHELVTIGTQKLRKTFSSLWSESADNVVPISGGLDSRLILAELLTHTNASRLYTYTYGVPGSYDYEIGNQVARHVGTRHTPIPTREHRYTHEELADTAIRTHCQATVFHHAPIYLLRREFGGALIWSGYVGDAVAGSHLHSPPSPTLAQAQRSHLRRRTMVRSTQLWRCSDDLYLPQMGRLALEPSVLTWDEQVLFAEAVPKFTAPLVLTHGLRWQTPFINTPWMDFMFSVPNRLRYHQRLMIDIARVAHSDLFALPSKNRLGHALSTSEHRVRLTFWANRARKVIHQFIPSINWPSSLYNDFNEGIRQNPSLRAVVRSSTAALRRRGICDWVDFDGLWRRHDWRLRNHGDALAMLASLEIVLQARERVRGAAPVLP